MTFFVVVLGWVIQSLDNPRTFFFCGGVYTYPSEPESQIIPSKVQLIVQGASEVN